MAATASSHSNHKKPSSTISRFRRRRIKETTISTSATSTSTTTHHHHPSAVSPENTSWCCPPAVSSYKPPPPPPPPPLSPSPESLPTKKTQPFFNSSSNLEKPRSVPTMTTTTTVYAGNNQDSSFTQFNSALTAGLLNPVSSPPPTTDKTRSSPTLFEMMANEPDSKIPNSPNAVVSYPPPKKPILIPPPVVIDKERLLQQRLSDLLASRSPGFSQFNDPNSSDVKLTLTCKDGVSVSMNAHRQILVGHSRFFQDYRWKGGKGKGNKGTLLRFWIVMILRCI